MLLLKRILFIVSITFCWSAYSQDTGSFRPTNTSFKNLFNSFRIGVPKNTPWVGSWWAYKNNGISYGYRDKSPAEKFDKFHGLRGKTKKWEIKNHTCDKESGESKKSCQGWWGHCNAWAAAAIKEGEPRKAFTRKRIKFTVADQKGLLTELYMENHSLFVGMTDKSTKTDDWIFNKNSREGRNRIQGGNSYDAFWDISPRAFFLVMTNYVGIQETGVVIDRFTGEQVWNQPVAGYRILPIHSKDIKRPVKKNGKTLYPVKIKMNLYWAEDGVGENEISLPFNIKRDTSDTFRVGDFHINKHYAGRSLAFTLFFDSKLKVSSAGKRVTSAGKIVGSGIWYHQEKEGKRFYQRNKVSFNDLHPDFIWLPTQVAKTSNKNYRNPQVDSKKVQQILQNKNSFFANGSGERERERPRGGVNNCVVERRNFFNSLKEKYSSTSRNSMAEACKRAMAKCKSAKRFGQSCKRK